MTNYYKDKIEILKDIFGAGDVELGEGYILVDNKRFDVIDDVIILSEKERLTDYVKEKVSVTSGKNEAKNFAEDIQRTFGSEWSEYSSILEEHKKEFDQYFDLVDINGLRGRRVCDLGCGSGRWSHFISDRCKELVLVDFSDAIFVARKNLKNSNNCLFFMCDIKQLPFRKDFCEFLFCLGVLHHLPVDCIDESRQLSKYSREILIFLYYALDNRPMYFRIILQVVTFARKVLCRIKNNVLRKIISVLGTLLVYLPLVAVGHMLEVFGFGKYVPLYEFYRNKTLKRIEQDVYDRFFTRIEQRVTRKQITALLDTYSSVNISENLPYWHFLCKRS